MQTSTVRTLLGLAIGDAYGVGFEFMTPREIKSHWASIPLRSIGGGVFDFTPGEFSDDTEMALLTLYSLMQKQMINKNHLKELYTLWAHHAKDIGIQTQNALLENTLDSSSEGNGALMRILPSVVYMHEVLQWDITTIKQAVRSISSITHTSVNIHRINDFFIDLLLNKNIEKHQSLIAEFLNTDGNNGWVFNTARIVYRTLLDGHLSLLDGLWKIISYAGDTDTACAIYTALRSYQDETLLRSLPINDFLNQESQMILDSFHTTCLHYYQPAPQTLPTLFAGQYPGSKSPSLHAIKMQELLSLECDCVISLMEETESERFRSYQESVRFLQPKIQFFQFPIVDMSIPSYQQLYRTVKCILELLKDNKKVYVHCWGGHGRTGVVIAAILIAYGHTPQNALSQIRIKRLQSPFGDAPSPQTVEQVNFVYNCVLKRY